MQPIDAGLQGGGDVGVDGQQLHGAGHDDGGADADDDGHYEPEDAQEDEAGAVVQDAGQYLVAVEGHAGLLDLHWSLSIPHRAFRT